MDNETKAEWSHDRTICPRCDGTGCRECKSRGEVATDAELVRVTCACGFTIDGRGYYALPSTTCPQCGTVDLEHAVEDAMPATERDDGPDYDDYDLEDAATRYGGDWSYR